MTGRVKFFVRTKGYGFIVGDDSKEYFVHHSNIISDEPMRYLMADSVVTFEVEQQPGRGVDRAVKVKETRITEAIQHENTVLR